MRRSDTGNIVFICYGKAGSPVAPFAVGLFITLTIKQFAKRDYRFVIMAMDTAAATIEEIKRCIGSGQYNAWVIGVTSSPLEKKEALDNPPCWHMWAAGTKTTARKIERYFLKTFPSGPASGRIRKGEPESLADNKMIYIYIC